MPIIKFIIKVVAGFFVVLVAIILLIAASMPSPEEVDQAVDDIKFKVAEDAETQYEMVYRISGTPIDRCVQAGFVAAAWLQAQNEERYSLWKNIELTACELAGMPR